MKRIVRGIPIASLPPFGFAKATDNTSTFEIASKKRIAPPNRPDPDDSRGHPDGCLNGGGHGNNKTTGPRHRLFFAIIPARSFTFPGILD